VRHTAYRDTNKYTERGVTKCHLDTDVWPTGLIIWPLRATDSNIFVSK
jgi:hypothetical protein